MSTLLFDGKVAIVTGGGSGIGRATAKLFARDGASVVVADVNAKTGREAVAEIVAEGGKAVCVEADVSQAADAERIVRETVQHFGAVDILVNNAAMIKFLSVTNTSEQDWDRVLGVNLKSVFLCSKQAIPEMLKRGGGAIVNVSSVHAFATGPNYAAYAASKGGVVALTRQMAVDYSPKGIRVNCVCPGITDTPMFRSSLALENDPASTLRQWSAMPAVKRVGQPTEVAELIVFLAGPKASFLTGATYLADGGMMAGF